MFHCCPLRFGLALVTSLPFLDSELSFKTLCFARWLMSSWSPGPHHLQKVAVVKRQTELAEGEDTPSFMVLMASKNISSQERTLQMSPRAIHHLPSCDLEKTGIRRIEPDG